VDVVERTSVGEVLGGAEAIADEAWIDRDARDGRVGEGTGRVGGDVVVGEAGVEGVFGIEDLIDTCVEVMAVLRVLIAGRIGVQAVVRGREESEVGDPGFIEVSRGDDGAASVGEVSGVLLLIKRGNNQGLRRCPGDLAIAFVVAEEEGLVSDDGSAKTAAELVLTEFVLGSLLPKLKVEASKMSLRKNSKAEPWNWLDPDFVMILMMPPPVRPTSAYTCWSGH